MEILSGWKEIAKHLNQGVRTVQRWELIGLPIHRVRTESRGQVIAFAEELNQWAKHTPLQYADLITACNTEIKTLKREVANLKRELKKLKSKSGRKTF